MNKDNNKLKNGYKAFYKNKTIEVWAETSYQAHLLAAEQFKAGKKSHLISVILCERAGGEQVIHSPNIL